MRCISVRIICGLVGLAAAGFLAASAHGLGVPTVSTPTVTAPSVSVPSLPTPTLPAPTVSTPTVTTAPLPAPTEPKPTLPSTTVVAPAPAPATTAPKTTSPVATTAITSAAAPPAAVGATAGAQTAGAAPAGGAPARSYGVAGASHTTRRGRAGSSLPLLRRVIARFTLERPARVHISIEELAPICRKLRTYVVRLPKGTHAFRFPVRRATEIGTYRVTALLRGHRIFSVRARRMHERVKLGGTANVCRQLTTRTAFSLSSLGTLGAPGFPAAAGKSGSSGQLHVKAAHGRRSASPPTSGAQPPEKNPLVRAVSLTDAPRSLQPLLFTLLAIAIVLLALAAAPQRVLPAGRAAAIVATRRAYFAAAGIWLLVVVAIVTAFS